MENSMKHKQEGKTSIINIYQRSNEKGLYEILFKNNAIGLDRKYIDKIFEAF